MLSAFDSLRLARRLVDMGLTEAQAEEIACVLRAATQLGALEIARKTDIQRLGEETCAALSEMQRSLTLAIESHDLETRVLAVRKAEFAHLAPRLLRKVRILVALATTAIAIQLAIAAALVWFWFRAWPV